MSSQQSGRLVAICLLPLLGACGGLPVEDGGEVEVEQIGSTEGIEQALRGTPITREGVVHLRYLNGYYCTGVMISPQVILTAGHCAAHVLPAGAKTAVVTGPEIYYQFPDGTKRCISAYPTATGCSAATPLRFTQWPDYGGETDAIDDFAVVTTDYQWYGPSNSDFAFIYTDTMSAYSRLQLYGYGGNAFGSGDGGGVLRTGTMAVDWYGSQHFILTEAGTRVCKGDSGGPAAVYASASGAELHVAGLFSNFVPTPGGFCGAEGDNARYTRLSGKVDWIKSTTGAPCTQITSTKTNRKVHRCY